MPRRQSEALIARRLDGRPVRRPVPAWFLGGLVLVCAGLVGFSLYEALRGRVSPAGLAGIAGVVVTYRAWRVNHPR